jgi:hypothetical protein
MSLFVFVIGEIIEVLGNNSRILFGVKYIFILKKVLDFIFFLIKYFCTSFQGCFYKIKKELFDG